MESFKIPAVPPEKIIENFIHCCLVCGLDGHASSHCPALFCKKCLAHGHKVVSCLVGWRRKKCKHLGHLAHQCVTGHNQEWRVKAHRSQTNSIQEKIWVVKKQGKGEEINLLSSQNIRELAILPLPLPQAIVHPLPAAMATFPVNPLAFLPEGMTIDHGPADHKAHIDLVLSPNAPLVNDKVLIAETNRFIPIHLRQQYSDDLRDLLEEAGYAVSAFDDHLFGLGSYTFVHTLAADTVVNLTFEIDDITTATFVKHNVAKNMRLTSFGQAIWILLLGFPIDYQTTSYISSPVEDFGLLNVWDNPRGNNKFFW
jgi:hypothetical protein